MLRLAAFVVLSISLAVPIEEKSCEAELYQHGDFSGWKAVFPVGVYDHAAMVARGAANDHVSAIKVIGADCKVEVYQHARFEGWKGEFPTGEYNHDAMTSHLVQNDAISSLKVIETDPGSPGGSLCRGEEPPTGTPTTDFTSCQRAIQWAKTDGVMSNPHWFIDATGHHLSKTSTWAEFQSFFAKSTKTFGCVEPCVASTDSTTPSAGTRRMKAGLPYYTPPLTSVKNQTKSVLQPALRSSSGLGSFIV